jgi:xylono-1,5-lactonase
MSRKPVGQIRCVLASGDTLGEGPIWDDRSGSLYWVDIYRQLVHHLDPRTGAHRQWTLPERIGFIIQRQRGGFVVGLKSGLAWLELPAAELTPLGRPTGEPAGNRFNDAKCDPHGRLWAGTMDDSCREPAGWLYRYEPDLRCERTDGGYVITNGPAFSPDARTLYHTDTLARVTYAIDVDSSGTLTDKRVLRRYADGEGNPDGMTVDADGYIWVAMFGSGLVLRLTSDGQVDRRIAMPVPNVTSCIFGGDNLSLLYITTATLLMSDEARARHPAADGLFCFEPGVRGLPTQRFAG